MRKLAAILTAMLIFYKVQGQEKSLVSLLKEGEINGIIRNYFLSTANMSGKDNYADALGLQVDYKTKTYHGFHIGISGSIAYRIFSSPLNEPDPLSGKPAKWERELFDVNHPDSYNGLDRLEELYVKYSWKKSYMTYGKIPVEYTPLINKSDGRIKPFVFQGGLIHYSDQEKQWVVDGSWIHRVSPRSMTEWFSIADAIGLTDNGIQPDGTKAEYGGNNASRGLGILHLGKAFKDLKVDIWDIYLDRLINTSWVQVEYTNSCLQLGAIYSYQIPHSYQKTLDYENRYVQPSENGQVFSGHLNYKNRRSTFKISYSRAFDTGRYLFPKELGRDQFYTSMPRSRMDGLGDVDVVSAGFLHQWNNISLSIDASALLGTRVGDHRYNKYNIDDFYQANTKINYDCKGFLKGLHIELLYVWKKNREFHQPLTVYHKSDYNQINLVTNFKF